jgi:hypothetical protein
MPQIQEVNSAAKDINVFEVASSQVAAFLI